MKKKYVIVYLSFSRIDKVKLFFKKITNNKNYNKYIYYIFSDQGRNKNEINLVKNVRIYLKSLNIKKKKLIFKKKNLGTNKMFKELLAKLFKKHDKIVIFEEDIIPNNYTLDYFDKVFYNIKNIKKTGLITAHSLLSKKDIIDFDNLFISRRSNLWGLGITKKTYKKMIFDEKVLRIKCLKNKKFLSTIKNFDDAILYSVSKFLYKSIKINMDLCIFINSILLENFTITPKRSLVFNSGIDGSGERAKISSKQLINDTFEENNKLDFKIDTKKIKIDYNYENIVKNKFSYSLISKLIKKIKNFV